MPDPEKNGLLRPTRNGLLRPTHNGLLRLRAARNALMQMAVSAGMVERFAAETTATYKQKLHNLIQQEWNGEIDRREFEKRMKELIIASALIALMAGLLEAGVALDELDDEVDAQRDEMDAWVAAQVAFIPAFALAIAHAREAGINERVPIMGDRIGWWADSLASFQAVSAARTERRRDELLTFGGPSGRESCNTCQGLMDQTHPASWWIENRLIPGIPGSDTFECGGWKCQHILANQQGVQRLPSL